MRKYPICITNEEPRMVEARKFAYDVQGERNWFIVHRDMSTVVVSDWSSGKRICDVPYMTLIAALGDEVSAAKSAIKALCDRVGEARVRTVLAGAKPLRGNHA